MSAAREQRYIRLIRQQSADLDTEEREREIRQMDICGEYDHIRHAEEARRQLDGALLWWDAPRVRNYATKAEAAQAARACGPAHFPARAFTAFESFWVLAYILPGGYLSSEHGPLQFRPATDEEAAILRSTMSRTNAERPLYIVTLAP